jgi:hypothetical protein
MSYLSKLSVVTHNLVEQANSRGNNMILYSGDIRFESECAHLPFWLRISVVLLFLHTNRDILRQVTTFPVPSSSTCINNELQSAESLKNQQLLTHSRNSWHLMEHNISLTVLTRARHWFASWDRPPSGLLPNNISAKYDNITSYIFRNYIKIGLDISTPKTNFCKHQIRLSDFLNLWLAAANWGFEITE